MDLQVPKQKSQHTHTHKQKKGNVLHYGNSARLRTNTKVGEIRPVMIAIVADCDGERAETASAQGKRTRSSERKVSCVRKNGPQQTKAVEMKPKCGEKTW